MEKHDKTFDIREGKPEIKACLIHAHLKAVKLVSVPDPYNHFGGVHFGLCPTCALAWEHVPEAWNIFKLEMDFRLRQLKEKDNEYDESR